MTPTFTTRGAQRHHYYVTRLSPGEDSKAAWRAPAGEIDRAVLGTVADWLRSGDRLNSGQEAATVEVQLELDMAVALAMPSMSLPDQRSLLLEREVTVQLTGDRLVLRLADRSSTVELPAKIVRRGAELKLVVTRGQMESASLDPVVVKLVVLAFAAQQSVLTGEPDPLVSHYSRRHFSQLLRISWLAPDLLTSILEGRQPPTLTGRKLLRTIDLPLSWAEQRRLFAAA